MMPNLAEVQEKISKYGLKVTLKKALGRVLHMYNCWTVPWIFQYKFYWNLLGLIIAPAPKRKRILGIWDFKALPWSLGDPLLFVESLSLLKLEYDAEEIDICVIYDGENPGGNRSKGDANTNINTKNAQEYMLDFLPLFSTSPYLGSVFQFNSRNEFYSFLKLNSGRYHIFPSLPKHLGETYNFKGGERLVDVNEFHKKHGYIPHLKIGERESSWAKWFYLNNLPKNTVPVALSLKRTVHSEVRNADPYVWLPFIDKCKQLYPEVIFIFIGLRDEAFDGLRERSNVFIAKEYGTTIMEDLALIRASIMYIGTASGVNVISMYSDLPYFIFQLPNTTIYGIEFGDSFKFANKNQKIFDAKIPVTPELLLNEFKSVYNNLEKNEWVKETSIGAKDKHFLPTSKAIK